MRERMPKNVECFKASFASFACSWKALFRYYPHPLWDNEPPTVPHWTESADKSDALQTLRARPSQRTTRQRLECVRLQRRFPKAGQDLMDMPIHNEP